MRHGAEITRWATRSSAEVDGRAVRLGWPGAARYLASCWQVDRVVLGGGGILKDEGLRLPLELLITAVTARIAGRPVALLAVGAGPFYTRFGRWMIRAIARLATVRTVRDLASARALAALGVSHVEVVADPVFSQAPSVEARDGGLGLDPDAFPTILVSVRPWFHKDASGGEGRWNRLVSDLAAALDEAVRGGRRIRFVGLYWPRDRLAAEQVRAAMSHAEGAIIDDEPATWPSLTAAVADAGIVVAMRYHALAAAVMSRRPTIALPYEPKVASLAEACRVSGIMPGEEGSGERFAALLRNAMRDPSSALPDPESVDHLRRRATVGLRMVLEDQS